MMPDKNVYDYRVRENVQSEHEFILCVHSAHVITAQQGTEIIN